MIPALLAGYRYDADTLVWSRPGFSGIAYSDGDEIEERIRGIVANSVDRRLFSTELHRAISDWPSRYHLSASRANIVRPFIKRMPDADVLEIGAGCGAVTRFIGERGARVLALEGSVRRASIARLRTADLPNVTVVADDFKDFDIATRFDFVTLIGVLEYAGVFVGGEEAGQRLLERARHFLKPGGCLIIAIENQLGLKYLAGAPEDHIGRPMYGVEGRYRLGEPQTYGLRQLVEMANRAGLPQVEVLAPFPDYKFPVSIVTQSGLAHQSFNAANLISESVYLDPQLPSRLAFSPELAWPVVARNGLALDLANSFLICASREPGFQVNPRILAFHYSTGRSEQFCKETVFLSNAQGLVEKQAAALKAGPWTPSHISMDLPAVDAYQEGKPISLELLGIVTRDGWSVAEVGEFLCLYRRAVLAITGKKEGDRLPGQYFDLIPRNIIACSDGSFVAIDQEWRVSSPIEIGHLIFRALRDVTHVRCRFAKSAGPWSPTQMDFYLAAFQAAGYPAFRQQILGYAAAEAAAQSEIRGWPVQIDEIIKPDSPLRNAGLFEAYADLSKEQSQLKTKVKKNSTEIIMLKEQISGFEKSPSAKLSKFLKKLGQKRKRRRRTVV